MYLPALAKDLYKSQKEVEQLELELQKENTPVTQEEIKALLRKAKAELALLRKVLEGRKEQSRASLYKPKSIF